VHVGKNGKRQVNLYDPDGTRVELMEPNTVDGKAVASSTAPPPSPPSSPVCCNERHVSDVDRDRP